MGSAGGDRQLEQRLEEVLAVSHAGTFGAFFQMLAEHSSTAHLVQMFDSTVVRDHVAAAGAKGGKQARRSAAPSITVAQAVDL